MEAPLSVAPLSVAPQDGSRERRIPVKGVRKLTAAAMVGSAFTAPHVTEFITVDMTPTMELRQRVAALPEFAGVKVTPLLFVAKALLLAVKRNPEINSSWDEAAQEIVVKDYVNLGIAAATPRGLLVPNVKDADALDLRGLAQALATLTETAREGRTTPADMTGGTITITNVGTFGVDNGTPILNPGESAILCFGAVRPTPWVVDGEVVVRQVTQLSLSFDHRNVDGQLGSQFLVRRRPRAGRPDGGARLGLSEPGDDLRSAGPPAGRSTRPAGRTAMTATTARQLADLVLDPGSWLSWDVPPVAAGGASAAMPRYAEDLLRARERSGEDEAIITGEGRLHGRRVAVAACEFSFLAGSVGVAAAERLVLAVERATRERLPLVVSPTSGGTRMQEGTMAFLQMVKISAAVAVHRARGLPYLVYLRSPTTGGVLASWGSLGHVTVAEPGALIGFLGPRVYEALYGEPFPEGVQRAENLYDHGLIDAVVAPHDLREVAARALDVLTAPRSGLPEIADVPDEPVPDVPAWESVERSRRRERPGVRGCCASPPTRSPRCTARARARPTRGCCSPSPGSAARRAWCSDRTAAGRCPGSCSGRPGSGTPGADCAWPASSACRS